MELYKNTKKFWNNIKVGDIIGLQDKQEIEAQIEDGNQLGETDYEVKYIRTFSAEGDHGILATYLLIEIENSEKDENLFLSVKLVDNEISLKIFYEVQEFEPGDRYDAINRGDEWIFEEPEETDNFRYSDLEYASTIIRDIDENEISFTKLPQGDLHGSCISIPEESGVGDIFVTLVEYSTDSECDNPYLMIIEEEELEIDKGDDWDYADDDYDEELDSTDYEECCDEEEKDYGGIIKLYLGSDLSPLDINLYSKEKK